MHELDDATAAAVASIELDENGRPKNIRLWSKTDAIDKAMRHLGLFEKGNRQQGQNLAIQVNLVGAPAPRRGLGEVGALSSPDVRLDPNPPRTKERLRSNCRRWVGVHAGPEAIQMKCVNCSGVGHAELAEQHGVHFPASVP